MKGMNTRMKMGVFMEIMGDVDSGFRRQKRVTHVKGKIGTWQV